MINNLKNFLFLMLLVFTITGCSKKIYPYRISDTVKNKQISDAELKQMNVKQFYNFIKVKDNPYSRVTAYIPSKSYSLIRRYCKLKNSVLRKYVPFGNISTAVLDLEGNLKASDRIVDYSTLHGCYLESTDEYFEIIRIDSHTQRFKDQYRDNVISISRSSKIDYLDYMDSLKKDTEKRVRRIESRYKEIQNLRNRTGTHSVIFYNGFSFNGNNKYKDVCIKSCKNYNIDNTGYSLLQESLDDN